MILDVLSIGALWLLLAFVLSVVVGRVIYYGTTLDSWED